MKLIENRESFLRKLKVRERLTVRAGLIHRNRVKVVSLEDRAKTIEGADGLITANKNLFLTLTIADCLPIFIYDPAKEVVGLIHGGWRSLAKNILTAALEKMVKIFGSLPKDILFGIGPGISKCHFEVKEDLLEEFKYYLPEVLEKRNKKAYLDLKEIAKIQLINSGVREENIEISPECTFCLPRRYFSYRRDRPEELEVMLAVIGRKNS